MLKSEYLEYAIKNGLVGNLDWYYTFLTTILSTEYKNKYINIKGGKLKVITNKGEEVLTDHIKGPIFSIHTKLILDKNSNMKSVNKKINTSLGYLIFNYILIEAPFEGTIPYIEKNLNIDVVVEDIGKRLEEDRITVPKYKTFVNMTALLEKLSKLVVISSTERNIVPPEGLQDFKKKLKKEYDDKYGSDWVTDTTKVVQYEGKLKDYLNDYLKSDKANNKFLSGKIKNNALVKSYLTIGLAKGFEEPGETITHIDNSLLDGYEKDNTKLAKLFNTARSASFDRGNETQKGGATAKDILRATSSLVVSGSDCGVKYGNKVTINKDILDSMVGRYMISKGKNVLLTKELLQSLIGKNIEYRSTKFCKNKDTSTCTICAGEKMSKYPTGKNLVLSDIGSTILNSSLKKMHNSIINTTKLDITTVLY